MENLQPFMRVFGLETRSKPSGLTELLSRASQEVLIVADRLAPFTLQGPDVELALQKALVKGVRIEIILGPDPHPSSVALLKRLGEKHKGVASIVIHKMSEPPRIHFAVIDGRDLSLENPHRPGEEKRQRITRFNNPGMALTLAKQFSQLKERAVETKELGK